MADPGYSSGKIVRDFTSTRICTMAGISAANKKLATFKELKTGLEMAIIELEKQRKTDQIVGKALLVARFTKATCDAFIGMATEMTKIVLPGSEKAAGLVNTAYGMTTPLAEAAGTKMAGGKVEVVKTAAAVTKVAAGLVDNPGTQLLIKTTTVKVEIINNALNKDQKGILKSSVDYMAELSSSTIEFAGYKKVAAFTNIAKQGFDYNQAIGEAFDDLIDSDYESLERYNALKRQIMDQAKKMSSKIKEMEDFIMSCETGQDGSIVLQSLP